LIRRFRGRKTRADLHHVEEVDLGIEFLLAEICTEELGRAPGIVQAREGPDR